MLPIEDQSTERAPRHARSHLSLSASLFRTRFSWARTPEMQAVPHPLGDPGLFARAGLVPPDGLNGVGPKKLDEAVPADGPPPSTIAEGFSRLQQLAGPVAAALGYANGPLSDAFQAALRRSLQNSLLQDPTLHLSLIHI